MATRKGFTRSRPPTIDEVNLLALGRGPTGRFASLADVAQAWASHRGLFARSLRRPWAAFAFDDGAANPCAAWSGDDGLCADGHDGCAVAHLPPQ